MTRKKEFGDREFAICLWDTFDNESILVGGEDTLKEAEEFVKREYGDKINTSGADQVEIVNREGNIVRRYSIT